MVASAGSGKTTAITQRVLSIARSANAIEILPSLVVVTFTNRAADEMQQRTRQALLQENFDRTSDCIQSRLLWHNSFVLHETPDRLRSFSWFACAAGVGAKTTTNFGEDFAQNQTRIRRSLSDTTARALRFVQARDLMELARRGRSALCSVPRLSPVCHSILRGPLTVELGQGER